MTGNTTTAGGAVDQEAVLARKLLRMESDVNRAGWDRAPQLHAILGPQGEPDRWTLEALMADPVFFERLHPRDAVRKFANFLSLGGLHGKVRQGQDYILDILAGGPLRAVVFATESWVLEAPSEDMPAERSRYRSIGDHPQGFEARWMPAVAPDGTFYVVYRRRGREPLVSWVNHRSGAVGGIGGNGTDYVIRRGGIIRSLCRIVNAVNARAGLPAVRMEDERCNRCDRSLPMVDEDPVCPGCGKGAG